MMKQRLIKLFSFFFISTIICNCSLYLPYKTYQKKRPKNVLNIEVIRELKAGNNLVLRLRTGERYEGKFIQYNQYDPEQYKQIYSDSLNTLDGLKLPYVGDSLRITLFSSEEIAGCLIGFDFNYLFIQNLQREDTSYIHLSDIKYILGSKEEYYSSLLIGQYLNKIPSYTEIMIQTEKGARVFPSGKIQTLELKVKKVKYFTSFLLGFGIDAILISITILFMLASIGGGLA